NSLFGLDLGHSPRSGNSHSIGRVPATNQALLGKLGSSLTYRKFLSKGSHSLLFSFEASSISRHRCHYCFRHHQSSRISRKWQDLGLSVLLVERFLLYS